MSRSARTLLAITAATGAALSVMAAAGSPLLVAVVFAGDSGADASTGAAGRANGGCAANGPPRIGGRADDGLVISRKMSIRAPSELVKIDR